MTEIEIATPVPPLPRRIAGKHFRGRCINAMALEQVHFVDCTFSDLDFTDFNARELHFERCHFNNIRLQGGSLEACSVRFSQLDGLHMNGISLESFTSLETPWRKISLQQCQAERWVMAGCSLEEAHWQDCCISYWTAYNTPVTNLTMERGEMQDGNWYGCALSTVTWRDCVLTRQVMGSCELQACGYAGNICNIMVWFTCQLHGIDLSKLNLATSSFLHSTLLGCRFEQTDLSAVLFNQTVLKQCDFSQAMADNTQFTDASLTECRFIETSLKGAQMQRARFVHCNLIRANFSHANLHGCDLRTSPLQPAITHKTRMFEAQLQPQEWALQTPEPLMAQIDIWYQRHQPGPQEPTHFPLLPSGASRYV